MFKNKNCPPKILFFSEHTQDRVYLSYTKDGGLEIQTTHSKRNHKFLLYFTKIFSCIHETMQIKDLFMKFFIMFIKALIKMTL